MFMLLMLAAGKIALQGATSPVVVDNGSVRLAVDRRSGRYELGFAGGPRIRAIDSVVRLNNGAELRASAFRTHRVAPGDIALVKDSLGSGTRVTVHHWSPNLPELRQVFWIYRGREEAIVKLEVTAPRSIESNYMAPLRTSLPTFVKHTRPLQSLFVPYDNDDYVRYRTDCWARSIDDMGSNEAGAVFDAGSRNGLVIGSIDHDIWKSGIRFTKSNEDAVSTVQAFAGARGPSSQRKVPHGMVSGTTIRTPRFVVGWYPDWRTGLERYGALNALVQPPLPWKGGVPFGWNSWAGHKNKLRAADASAAADFLALELPGLRNDGVAYVNLDSYWDNLTKPQQVEFVRRVHERGLKAGIYWSPFVAWGDLKSRVAGDNGRTYLDLALKNAKGAPMPRFSGAVPLDPTNPATLSRIDRQLGEFVAEGFDYVKLDFLSHGAVEGRHFDPSIQTGTAAYRVGMQRVLDDLSPDKIGRPFFISLSIAPLFPQGYGHSRRISCDAFANIGSTEYLLNSASYGWWTNRTLYEFNDPDSACVYQPLGERPVTEAEGRTRLTASAISGGMLFEGDNLTLPAARARASALFTNGEVVRLARLGLAFRPVEAAPRDRAANAFYAVDARSGDIFMAAFNFSRLRRQRIEVAFSRLSNSASKRYVHDLWTGANSQAVRSIKLDLGPMECALLRLRKR